jgi:hypothetical protein
MSEMNKSQKSAAVHNVHLMFTPERAQVFLCTFIIGALGRSVALDADSRSVGSHWNAGMALWWIV